MIDRSLPEASPRRNSTLRCRNQAPGAIPWLKARRRTAGKHSSLPPLAPRPPGLWRRCAGAFLALLLLFPLPPTLGASPDPGELLFSKDGYRIAQFRAPVHKSAPGAITLSTGEVVSLRANDRAVLIDVLPAPPRPQGLSPEALWLPPERRNIPGSLWLPNVGYGRLSDALDRYFRRNLHTATRGDRNRPLVFYCLADCWMSWNAAKRAAAYGYSRVYWYPEGTTGWGAAGLPLATSAPAPTHEGP
jgi:PQQ-dependent catabolism-associated CXXCW motif protein